MGLLNKFRQDGKKKSLEKEVSDNLSALLNTKQLFGAWQKGLGMQSYATGKSRADLMDEIVADLKYNIETYEKRLKLVAIDVMSEKNLFNMRFQIKCLLGGQFHSYYVGFKQSQKRIEVGMDNEESP